MKIQTIFFLILLLALCSQLMQAQIPRTLSYQGVLTDSLGNPKADNTYNLTFRLYDDALGGSALWTEIKILQVKRGLFSTILGDQTTIPDSLMFDRPYWLSIQIASEQELSPRIPLTAVGYSLYSIRADTANFAATTPQQAFVDSARIAGTIPNNSITSQKILDGTIQRVDVAPTFTSPYADTALFAKGYPSQGYVDSARIAGTVRDSSITNSKIKVPLSLSGLTPNAVFDAYGTAFTTGVAGGSQNGYGLLGTSQNGTGIYASGKVSIIAYNSTKYPYNRALIGMDDNAIAGYSNTDDAIIGISRSGKGVWGQSGGNGAGVVGTDTSSGSYGEIGKTGIGVYGYAKNSGTSNAYGGAFTTAEEGTGTHVGVSGSAWSNSTSSSTGVSGLGNNKSTGEAYGGYFIAQSLGTGIHFGLRASGYGSSPSPVYGAWCSADNNSSGSTQGVYGYARNISTGSSYGGYFIGLGDGSNTAYGLSAYANNSSGGNAIGGYFETPTPGTGIIGISKDGFGIVGVGKIGIIGRDTVNGNYGEIGTAGAGINGVSTNEFAIHGISTTNYGIYGQSSTNTAVVGESNSGSGVRGSSIDHDGVIGISSNSIRSGVYGSNDVGYGVFGRGKRGVMGESNDSIGVHGKTNSYSGGAGVFGEASTTIGYADGVFGKAYAYSSVGGRFTNDGEGIALSASSNGNTVNRTTMRIHNNSSTYGMAAYITNVSSYHTAHFQNSGTGGVLFLQNAGDGSGTGGNDFITAVGTDGGDPQFKVLSSGEVRSDVGFNTPAADFAEMLPAEDGLHAGDVLAIGEDGRLILSTEPYQTNVAGVYSTQPGFTGGKPVDGEIIGTIPLAISGIVPVKVSVENGSIKPGDLLVSSSTPGYAMKGDKNSPQGSVIGKALEKFTDGKGVIKILAILQ